MPVLKFAINPVAKPRMTRMSSRIGNPRIKRYWEYVDELRAQGLRGLPPSFRVDFGIPMPKSWSQVKKDAHEGMPHQQTPDTDNLIKAFSDAAFTRMKGPDDREIWQITMSKRWARTGYIRVEWDSDWRPLPPEMEIPREEMPRKRKKKRGG